MKPVVSALTIKLGRRLLLMLALAVYVLGNAFALISVNFGELVVARVVTGSIHGLFIGVACSVAAALVPPAQRGRAISMVFGGIAVATVFGVPLGTLVGQALGWKAAFAGVGDVLANKTAKSGLISLQRLRDELVLLGNRPTTRDLVHLQV